LGAQLIGGCGSSSFGGSCPFWNDGWAICWRGSLKADIPKAMHAKKVTKLKSEERERTLELDGHCYRNGNSNGQPKFAVIYTPYTK